MRDEFISILENEVLFYDSNNIGTNIYIFGTLSGNTTYNSLYDTSGVNGATTGVTNVLKTSSDTEVGADFDSRENETWYYSLFNMNGDETEYEGISFGFKVTTYTLVDTIVTGECTLYFNNQKANPIDEYHQMVVGTLRSRGKVTYSTDNEQVYEVSGKSESIIVTTGNYSGVTKDPFGTFQISGATISGTDFKFDTSFTVSNKNYLGKVFGRSNFGKSRTDVPLFLEEDYTNLLTLGYREGKIRGLSQNLYKTNKASSTNTDSLGWFLDRYQTPKTPYLVSELRGSDVVDLFRFILISDGNSANREVKISIVNISFSNSNFDVVVRDYYDTDANPVVLEKFTNCGLDPELNNFVS